jgi:AcrR family transcriptional regulator
MSAVSRATGAPSGSLYHRFPSRAALCGELWLRTIDRFQTGFLALLTSDDDPATSCVIAAQYVIGWCRREPEQAQVLLAGPQPFCRDEWTADLERRNDKATKSLRTALRSIARRLGLGERPTGERVITAVADIPYAVVRRHLRSGTSIPPNAEVIVEVCVRALLDTPLTEPASGTGRHSAHG